MPTQGAVLHISRHDFSLASCDDRCVIVDAHVHLQPHGEQPPVDRALIEAYVEQAQRNGVDVVVFTEHLFRFKEALQLLDGWWDCDPNPVLRRMARQYWLDHVNLSLPEYVSLIEQAKSD